MSWGAILCPPPIFCPSLSLSCVTLADTGGLVCTFLWGLGGRVIRCGENHMDALAGTNKDCTDVILYESRVAGSGFGDKPFSLPPPSFGRAGNVAMYRVDWSRSRSK